MVINMDKTKQETDIQILRLTRGAKISCDSGRYIFLLFTEGTGYVRHSDTIYDAESSDCIILHGEDSIYLSPSHFKACTVYYLTFQKDQVLSSRLPVGCADLIQAFLPAAAAILSLNGKSLGVVSNLFDTCQLLAADRLPYAGYLLNQTISMLILYLARLYDVSNIRQKKSRGSSPHTLMTEQVCQYVRQNYSSSLSLPELAELVHTNPSYLSRVFKQSTGISLVSYITRIRIEAAKKMLTDTDELVVDIASACGYNYVPHFNKIFKKMTGMTPVQYKKLNQKSVF